MRIYCLKIFHKVQVIFTDKNPRIRNPRTPFRVFRSLAWGACQRFISALAYSLYPQLHYANWAATYEYPVRPGTTPNAGPPFLNIFLTSSTSSSGRSYAAKCPPEVCSTRCTTLPVVDIQLHRTHGSEGVSYKKTYIVPSGTVSKFFREIRYT